MDPQLALMPPFRSVFSPHEREHLRSGMHTFLESVQAIVDALPENKIALVAASAKKSGMGAVHDVPISIATKLPAEFVLLSMDAHQKSDALSRESSETGRKGMALNHLREILANCIAYHATCRISPE